MENLIQYQNARIEALEKRNAYLEAKLIEAKELLNSIANEIEVINPEIVE